MYLGVFVHAVVCACVQVRALTCDWVNSRVLARGCVCERFGVCVRV